MNPDEMQGGGVGDGRDPAGAVALDTSWLHEAVAPTSHSGGEKRGRSSKRRARRRTLSPSIGSNNYMSGVDLNDPMTFPEIPQARKSQVEKSSSNAGDAESTGDDRLIASLKDLVSPASGLDDVDLADPSDVAGLFAVQGVPESTASTPPLGVLGVLANQAVRPQPANEREPLRKKKGGPSPAPRRDAVVDARVSLEVENLHPIRQPVVAAGTAVISPLASAKEAATAVKPSAVSTSSTLCYDGPGEAKELPQPPPPAPVSAPEREAAPAATAATKKKSRNSRRRSIVMPSEAKPFVDSELGSAGDARPAGGLADTATAVAAATAGRGEKQPQRDSDGNRGTGGSCSRKAAADEFPLASVNATSCLSRSLAAQRGWKVSEGDTTRALVRAYYSSPQGSQRARRIAARLFCLTGFCLLPMTPDDARILCQSAGDSFEWGLGETEKPRLVSQPPRRETREQKRELVVRIKPIFELMDRAAKDETLAVETATGVVSRKGSPDGYYYENRETGEKVDPSLYKLQYSKHIRAVAASRLWSPKIDSCALPGAAGGRVSTEERASAIGSPSKSPVPEDGTAGLHAVADSCLPRKARGDFTLELAVEEKEAAREKEAGVAKEASDARSRTLAPWVEATGDAVLEVNTQVVQTRVGSTEGGNVAADPAPALAASGGLIASTLLRLNGDDESNIAEGGGESEAARPLVADGTKGAAAPKEELEGHENTVANATAELSGIGGPADPSGVVGPAAPSRSSVDGGVLVDSSTNGSAGSHALPAPLQARLETSAASPAVGSSGPCLETRAEEDRVGSGWATSGGMLSEQGIEASPPHDAVLASSTVIVKELVQGVDPSLGHAASSDANVAAAGDAPPQADCPTFVEGIEPAPVRGRGTTTVSSSRKMGVKIDGSGCVGENESDEVWSPLNLSPVSFPAGPERPDNNHVAQLVENRERGQASGRIFGRGDCFPATSAEGGSDSSGVCNVGGVSVPEAVLDVDGSSGAEAKELAVLEERLWAGWDALLAEYRAAAAVIKSRRQHRTPSPAAASTAQEQSNVSPSTAAVAQGIVATGEASVVSLGSCIERGEACTMSMATQAIARNAKEGSVAAAVGPAAESTGGASSPPVLSSAARAYSDMLTPTSPLLPLLHLRLSEEEEGALFGSSSRKEGAASGGSSRTRSGRTRRRSLAQAFSSQKMERGATATQQKMQGGGATATPVLGETEEGGGGDTRICGLCCKNACDAMLRPCEHLACGVCAEKLRVRAEQSGEALSCPWDRQPVEEICRM